MDYNDSNLLELYGKGLSYTEIAKELNVTRCVIAGRLYRIRHQTPEVIVKRQQGINPTGKVQDYSKRKIVLAYRQKKFVGPSRTILKQLLDNLKQGV